MNSTQLVRQEIGQFLSSEDPEVLCISGERSIGKTYTWQTMNDAAKKYKDKDLSNFISRIFQFNNVDSASVSMRKILRRTKKTLTRIGKESKIDAHRVKNYGIEVKDGDAEGNNP